MILIKNSHLPKHSQTFVNVLLVRRRKENNLGKNIAGKTVKREHPRSTVLPAIPLRWLFSFHSFTSNIFT
jgi:hypothetical protein